MGNGNSTRCTPTSNLGWNAVFDRPYDYGRVAWGGVVGGEWFVFTLKDNP